MSGLTLTGLKQEIERVEDCITLKKKLGESYSFEEDLLKEWRRYLPGGRHHHKLATNAPD